MHTSVSVSELLTSCSPIETTAPTENLPPVTDLVYDSRCLVPGCLFVCLTGAHADGHDYASSAYAKGCRLFAVERLLPLPEDAVQLRFANTRQALAELSAAFYDFPTRRLTVIGVTGTKGKTTTAILLSSLLSGNGIPCAYIGSNGVTIGDIHFHTVNTTPESRELQKYFRMMVDNGYTHVVMEVSSQALHTYRVYGIPFDTCLFTNLYPDHIGPGEHTSFADYRDCKKRLFSEYGCRNIVTNLDDAEEAYITENPTAHRVTYAIDHPADFRAGNIHPFRSETALGIDFSCLHAGERTPVRLRTPGDFSVYNALCAIAAASLYGIQPSAAAAELARLSIRGRFEIVDALDGITFLIDYAHNQLSLDSALRVLRAYHPHRLLCVFGSVGCRTKHRRKELGEVAGALADAVIITSDNPDTEDPMEIAQEILSYYDTSKPWQILLDREEAVRTAVRMAEPGDIVLFAGKGHEDYQLIDGQKLPFSEREIILDEAALVKERMGIH